MPSKIQIRIVFPLAKRQNIKYWCVVLVGSQLLKRI